MRSISDSLGLDVRSFLLVSIFFSTVSGLGLYSMCQNDILSLKQSYRIKEKTHNQFISEVISMDLTRLFTDLELVSKSIGVLAFLENQTASTRNHVEAEFKNLCTITKNYDQIRILDNNGMELVRINYNNGKPEIVPQKNLQDKSDRYYFIETRNLPTGDVYVSPFDLNIENGMIEQPLKPMIRVATAIQNAAGERLGIVILNYLGNRIINNINSARGSADDIMLLNAEGYWLSSYNKKEEWSFMYNDRKSLSFANEHPNVWKQIQAASEGSVFTPEGYYIFSTITVSPSGHVMKNTTDRKWKLVYFTPQSVLDAQVQPVINGYIQIYLGALCFIILGAISRARGMYSRKQSRIRLEQARKDAEHANKAKSDFLARMSHEIRTPMNAVIGLTHLALKTDLSAKQRDYLNKISMSSHILLGVINDILDFSKIESDRLELNQLDFLLDDVLNNTINMLGLQAEDKGIEFLLAEESAVPNSLIGDSLRLGQVLYNLVGNAIKFTESGMVLLSVNLNKKEGSRVTIQFIVKDTGIGISKDQLSRLFQPFCQADVSITRRFGGSGLGLVISKMLIEKMGGVLTVQSERGKGSEFSFILPFTVRRGEKRTANVQSESLRGMRVLIADDNEMSRIILRDILESFSFEVYEVPNGRDAIRMISLNDISHPFKLLITDWQMPDIDGVEVIKQIKNNTELMSPPKVIMLTAYGYQDVLFHVREMDIDGFMLKPINRSVLFDTIMEIFDEKSKHIHIEHTTDQASIPSHIAGKSILLAEDNVINQQVAREILEDAKLLVHIANNGREVLEMLESSTYDAILMDIQMPEMDGLEATREIRTHEQWQGIPIIAMTAHALVGDKEKSLIAGMNDHITKPIDPDVLIKVLAKWLPQEETRVYSDVQPESNTTKDDDGEFPCLHGIDINTGLSRLRGNKSLYKKLLQSFQQRCEEEGALLLSLANTEEFQKAEHIAHSLKGVAGNLGADDLHRILARMETTLERKDYVSSSLLTLFDAERIAVIEGIQCAFPPKNEDVTLESEVDIEELKKLKPQLQSLLEYMEDHDIESRQLFESLRPELNRIAPRLSQELGNRLDVFDFPGGKQQLEAFFSQMQQGGDT